MVCVDYTLLLIHNLQAFTMSANEKEICKNLATELFNLVPSSNDLDITDIIEGIGIVCCCCLHYPVIGDLSCIGVVPVYVRSYTSHSHEHIYWCPNRTSGR